VPQMLGAFPQGLLARPMEDFDGIRF